MIAFLSRDTNRKNQSFLGKIVSGSPTDDERVPYVYENPSLFMTAQRCAMQNWIAPMATYSSGNKFQSIESLFFGITYDLLLTIP